MTNSTTTSTIREMSPADEKPLGDRPGQPLTGEEMRQYRLFDGISAKMLERLRGSVWLRTHEPGEVIWRQGEFGSTAFYVLSGTVDVSINVAKVGTTASPNAVSWLDRLRGRGGRPRADGK